LAGGIVGSGSTCGVVVGGAVGLGLLHDKALQEGGIEAKVGLLSLVGEYSKWFKDNFKTTLCRERTGIDFYTPQGQRRYMLPDKMGKCLSHLIKTVGHLQSYRDKALPRIEVKQEDRQLTPIHCAQEVLKGIRGKTDIGDPLLERLSIVFDGGIGLQGGACGALAGAIMAIGIPFGMDIREMSFIQASKASFDSFKNLLVEKPKGKPEPYGVGKDIVQRFKEEAGAIECCEITGKKFQDWRDFQDHMHSPDKCKGLIELAISEGARAIEQHR
jgi:C_GCAxxG_C_C family probable redox protein